MLVDLDHLLAEPVLDTLRCGIGFHLYDRGVHNLPSGYYSAVS